MDVQIPRTFTCDVCGGLIEKPEEGFLEWKYEPGSGVKLVDFRIVHQFKKSCFVNDYSSCTLDAFLGFNGMARMLAMLNPKNGGVADISGWIKMFYRLHIPHFEEARNLLPQDGVWRHFQEEMLDALDETVETE
jgi:hypothetical protein